jgi:hypothetical protein
VSSQYLRFSVRGAATPRRAALLEQLLARADASRAGGDWRADAFRVIAPQAAMPAIASAALCADCGATSGAWVCLATPVHYVAEMTNVRLSQNGILSIEGAAAETLALDFNHVWNGSGIRLIAGGSARLYCIFDQMLNATTRDPQEVLDRHIEEFLPAGPDAPRLRQLMSELEMWLFEHATNNARARLDLPRMNGLWLWGGGAPLASLPRLQGWVAGDDLFFNALRGQRSDSGEQSGGDEKPGGRGKSDSGEQSGGGEKPGGCGKSDSGETSESGETSGRRATSYSGVIIAQTPGDEGWDDMESRWIKPAVAQLRAGRVSRLEISAADRSFTLTARSMRRFWRRSKPWWESFA